MDFGQIRKAAQGYGADMNRFLREMISYPSESCEEKEVVACIKREMEKLGYDEVEVDGLAHDGSDVEATLRAGYDIRHGLIGAGVYASHGYERSHRDGVLNTLRVLRGYLF